MKTKFKQRLQFLGHVWRLSYPYWVSGERWIARGLLLSIVCLNLGSIYIAVRVNKWYADFYNSLQEKNFAAFTEHLWFFAILAVIYIVLAVYQLYLNQMLQIRWRRWMTKDYLDKWFKDRIYYKLELEGDATDNPDQRISQDIAFFTSDTLNLVLGLFNATLTLFSFVIILWGISGSIQIPLPFIESGLTIPGYMVWFAVLYAFVGTWLTHLIGRKLIGINFNLEKYQAHFRYNLVRFRENSESIALYQGEEDEKRGLLDRFNKIWKTWWDLMICQKRLTWFTSAYGQVAIVFPILVAAPRYFKGLIDLGQLMQISQAFGQVQGSLSWFINAYTSLADWKASVNRLISFDGHLADLHAKNKTEGTGPKVNEGKSDHISIDLKELSIPTGRKLLENVQLELTAGDNILIEGPSGSGKSSFFRALSGIWPYGHGTIQMPKGKTMFLPQKPYLPIDTLRNIVTYPSTPGTYSDENILQALERCELGTLKDYLSKEDNWSMRLSGGEQQRLAIARALLAKPDWLLMDEATSAVDKNLEKKLYAAIKSELPTCTLISISHHPENQGIYDKKLSFESTETGTKLALSPI